MKRRRVDIIGGGEIYSVQIKVPPWAWAHLFFIAVIALLLILDAVDYLTGDRLFAFFLGPAPY